MHDSRSAVRHAAAAVLFAIVALAGCSGDDEPEAVPSRAAVGPTAVAPPARPRSAKPTAKPSPQPKRVPLEAVGAFLSATADEGPVAADPRTGCFNVYPGLSEQSCAALQLDGGTLLWLAGMEDIGGGVRRRVLRLLTFDPATGGYRLRFISRDPAGGWTGFSIGPARLTGNGVDGLVVRTELAGNGGTYDVLTWRAGGPLVLRGHRPPARDLRVVAREGRLDDYQPVGGRFFQYRRIQWDGARLTIADFGRVKASEVPPPA
ncbi:MAG TPA: hypothetical protein VNB94_01750 [Mycobacteriales bacterium]|nr:hypothetical protein [Mycobacteriales bacterium]